MASLTNTKIKDTYDGLLKTTDNDALGGTYKLITDGLGNSSNVYLGTGGRLGIGTSSPSSELTVNGQIEASSDTTTPSGGNAYFYKSSAGAVVSGYSTIIETGGLGSRTERLRVDNNGNVGIGTTNGDIFGRFYTRSVGIDSAGITKIQIDGASYTGIDFGVNGTRNGEINNTSTSFGINTIDARPLTFTTNNTERMRIDSSGTTTMIKSSSGASTTPLVVRNSGSTVVNTESKIFLSTVANDDRGAYISAKITDSSNGNALILATNTAGSSPTEKMRISSGGDTGIGESSPQSKLHVTSTTTGAALIVESDGGNQQFVIKRYSNTNEQLILGYHSSDYALIQAVEQGVSYRPIVLNSLGGDVLFGVTSITDTSSRTYGNAFSGSGSYGNWTSWGTGAHTHAIFRNGTNAVGSITTSTTATAYNTSSDYRLKENVVDLTGALDRVDQLEPKRFNFIADEDTTVDGFLAHEVQDIVPEAVTGEKDAVDDEGNPEYQGIDQSKIVPLLVGAIKELKAEIETLKSQINS